MRFVCGVYAVRVYCVCGVGVSRERRIHGAVWVWLAEGPPVGAPPPLRLPGTPRRRLRARPQRFDAGFVDVVEQAIDSSHHPFVHRGAMGARQPTEVPPIRVDVDEAASALEWEYERAPPGAPGPEMKNNTRI